MNQRLELHNINNETLIEIINRYGNQHLRRYTNDSSQETVFCFDTIYTETISNQNNQKLYDILYGRVKTGEYGIESELVNQTTGNLSYNRTTDDADVMPFGFAILIPDGSINNAIIVIQSIGIYGMKKVLEGKIIQCIKDINNEYRFEMGVILPKVVLDRYFEHGTLQKIRLIRYSIPNDLSERYGLNCGVNEFIEERVIRKPQGFLENKKKELHEWRNGERRYDAVIQLDDFEHDDLKMEFSFGRNSKTISLKNIDNLQMCEDITDLVRSIGGHPEFSSLCVQMKETGEFYLKAKGLIVE